MAGYEGVGTVRNVLVGAAGVFISTSDSTTSNWNTFFAKGVPAIVGPRASRRPENTLKDDGVTYTAAEWRNVGFTSEGLEVAYEPTFGDVEVDQLLDSALIFKQSMRVTANTTFAEATLENIMTVWGLPGRSPAEDGTGTVTNGSLTRNNTTQEETLDIAAGALGDEPLERSIVFLGKGPRTVTDNKYRERIYHIKRAIQTESSSHALRRNESTTLPASFRLLPDASASTATYGKIVDRVLTS
jgi:hypothetical protein